MTHLLNKIMKQLRQLPEADQDMYATILQDELADNEHWRQQFGATQGQLSNLAAQVRADIRAGRVEDCDPADL